MEVKLVSKLKHLKLSLYPFSYVKAMNVFYGERLMSHKTQPSHVLQDFNDIVYSYLLSMLS
jgi:hypothetical protein